MSVVKRITLIQRSIRMLIYADVCVSKIKQQCKQFEVETFKRK